jgi:Mlc titration factor MtfA (ptsG expression regulator)
MLPGPIQAERVLIAAHAALLLLNRRAGYFRNLRQILVYPGIFVAEHTKTGPGGIAHEARQALSGESWQQGQVILAWDAVLEGASIPDDGRNVVIHEFAHQLDQETGAANGAPFLGRRERYARWAAVLSSEFEQLREAHFYATFQELRMYPNRSRRQSRPVFYPL